MTTSSSGGTLSATGIFVAVVGPSGVGKDSVIDYGRSRVSPDLVRFVRRVVTRTADAGSEDHDSMTPDDFTRADAQGRFALSWSAHGLRYGLPISLDADLATGRIVVANLSRAVLPLVMARYPSALVVEITAQKDIIAQRLAARGRESNESVAARMNRSVPAALPASTLQIDNSGALSDAGDQFVRVLHDLARVSG